MTEKQRIEAFDSKNKPFYICNHDGGLYSLCLPFTFLTGEYESYCQNAFDRYAEEHGEQPRDEYGLHNHGNGYEWERVFKEAFRDDPDIGKIKFDCEAGGFYCYANDLGVLERLGSAFREICENEQRFQALVNVAVPQEDEPGFGTEQQDFKLKM